eukprot:11555262-Alexandrium_andersonii.AAC.1
MGDHSTGSKSAAEHSPPRRKVLEPAPGAAETPPPNRTTSLSSACVATHALATTSGPAPKTSTSSARTRRALP